MASLSSDSLTKVSERCVRMYYMATEIGDWLLVELNKRNWSQNELGRRAKISSATVSNLITGAKKPEQETLKSVAEALRVPVAEVLQKAGILPKRSGTSENAERLLYYFDQMDEDQQNDVIIYADFILRR